MDEKCNLSCVSPVSFDLKKSTSIPRGEKASQTSQIEPTIVNIDRQSPTVIVV